MLRPRNVFPHLYLTERSVAPIGRSGRSNTNQVSVERLPGGCVLYTLPAPVAADVETSAKGDPTEPG